MALPTWIVEPVPAADLQAMVDEIALRPVRIAESVLGVAAASVSFASIPATYRHLYLEVQCRGSNASAFTAVSVRFNNDSSAIYDYVNWQGSGSGASAAETLSQTSAYVGDMPAASALASTSAMYAITIPRYAGTTFLKTFNTTQTSDLRSTAASANLLFAKMIGGVYRSTNAINRVDLLAAAGNFVAGSTFSLYGWP